MAGGQASWEQAAISLQSGQMDDAKLVQSQENQDQTAYAN
jgi:hypothetical protein